MSKISFIFAFFLAACGFASQRASAATSSRLTYNDRYGVLSDRNIFLKDRSHPATRASSSTQPARASDPEQSVVLRGVVFEDNAFRAYVENASSGEVKRLSVGDSVGRGKTGEIDLNGIWYEGPTSRIWVEIGCDLTGQAAAPPPEEMISATTEPSTMPSNLAGLNPNDPTLTMEQKLKLRRLQELKGKQ